MPFPENSFGPDVVSAICVTDLSFSYGDTLVLKDVDLTVEQGEFVGLIGPNAGGKSTLLKLIMGLLKPQVGTVGLFGRSPQRARRLLGYVPQYPRFARDFPISVRDMVLMGRLGRSPLFGFRGAEDRAAVHAALERVDATQLAGRRIGALSGGQLQRVLLARALASEPRLLILDEPTANIDRRSEIDVFDLLGRMKGELTILVVSHDVAFISSYVDRVACLNRTLTCHPTAEISPALIHELYGEAVRGIIHSH